MKKLFACLLVLCMLLSGMTAFAAQDAPAADADMVIEHEAQGDVMPISETEEEIPAADGQETAEIEEAEETEKADEAETIVIDAEKLAKDVLVIDGKEVKIAKDMGAIVIEKDVIFVPVRVALEAVGYQVSWAEKEQMVMAANYETNAMFIMQLDNPLLFYLSAEGVEGKMEMEASPFKNENEWRTYVPINGLAKALGFKIGFDEETGIIELGK